MDLDLGEYMYIYIYIYIKAQTSTRNKTDLSKSNHKRSMTKFKLNVKIIKLPHTLLIYNLFLLWNLLVIFQALK